MDSTEHNEQEKVSGGQNRSNIQRFSPKRRSVFSYILPVLLILAVLGSSFFRFFSSDEVESVGISELYADAEAGKVEEFTICDGKVEAKLKGSDTKKVANYRGTNFEDILLD
ncbi:MAG: hypothetical protein PHS44_00160, partial [Candidatus Dojkabacteria bacterium]|nr:hypothetical protein [Candidatus Dojkabacteria bacterium]